MNLPGYTRKLTTPSTCERCGAEASFRMQGETDSFGAEYIDLCESCLNKTREEMHSQPCECCGSTERVRPWRDPEEGFYGPVYELCLPCRQRRDQEFLAYMGEEEILDVLGAPVEDLPDWEVEEDADWEDWDYEWEDEPVRAYCPRGA